MERLNLSSEAIFNDSRPVHAPAYTQLAEDADCDPRARPISAESTDAELLANLQNVTKDPRFQMMLERTDPSFLTKLGSHFTSGKKWLDKVPGVNVLTAAFESNRADDHYQRWKTMRDGNRRAGPTLASEISDGMMVHYNRERLAKGTKAGVRLAANAARPFLGPIADGAGEAATAGLSGAIDFMAEQAVSLATSTAISSGTEMAATNFAQAGHDAGHLGRHHPQTVVSAEEPGVGQQIKNVLTPGKDRLAPEEKNLTEATRARALLYYLGGAAQDFSGANLAELGLSGVTREEMIELERQRLVYKTRLGSRPDEDLDDVIQKEDDKTLKHEMENRKPEHFTSLKNFGRRLFGGTPENHFANVMSQDIGPGSNRLRTMWAIDGMLPKNHEERAANHKLMAAIHNHHAAAAVEAEEQGSASLLSRAEKTHAKPDGPYANYDA